MDKKDKEIEKIKEKFEKDGAKVYTPEEAKEIITKNIELFKRELDNGDVSFDVFSHTIYAYFNVGLIDEKMYRDAMISAGMSVEECKKNIERQKEDQQRLQDIMQEMVNTYKKVLIICVPFFINFVINGIWNFVDWQNDPAKYKAWGSPWYMSRLVPSLVAFLIAFFGCFLWRKIYLQKLTSEAEEIINS